MNTIFLRLSVIGLSMLLSACVTNEAKAGGKTAPCGCSSSCPCKADEVANCECPQVEAEKETAACGCASSCPCVAKAPATCKCSS